jgi:hypothetical protein
MPEFISHAIAFISCYPIMFSGRMENDEALNESRRSVDLIRKVLIDAQELVYSAIAQHNEEDIQ